MRRIGEIVAALVIFSGLAGAVWAAYEYGYKQPSELARQQAELARQVDITLRLAKCERFNGDDNNVRLMFVPPAQRGSGATNDRLPTPNLN
jgi:hypothetical protein